MRILLLAMVALLVAGAVGWLVLARAPAGPGAGTAGGSGPAGDGGGPASDGDGPGGLPPGDGAAAGSGPGGTSAGAPPADAPPVERDPDFWKREVDGVPPRDPGPVPEGGAGERFDPEALKGEDKEKATALFDRLHQAQVGRVLYRSRSLESVLRELSDRTDVKIELGAETLRDEPVDMDADGIPLIDVLRHVALTRNLRFTIEPDRVVITR